MFTAKDYACFADGANGSAYTRRRLAELLAAADLPDEHAEAVKVVCAELRGDMSDDDYETEQALDLLNVYACDDDVYFEFDEGNLMLRRTDECLAKQALDLMTWHVGESMDEDGNGEHYAVALVPDGIDAYTLLSELCAYSELSIDRTPDDGECVILSDDNGTPFETYRDLVETWKSIFDAKEVPQGRWHLDGAPRDVLSAPRPNLF